MKHWTDAGEEWSRPWGSSAAQWDGTILPRIRDYLPAGTVLEIAPGFGRWTHYLRNFCDNLWAVEKSEQCFEACRTRFSNDPKVKVYHNDGQSLAMIPDGSVDFVFSFDSLVHVRREFIESYLGQLGIKLKQGGFGFFHHSNLGAYANSPRSRLPEPVVKILQKTRMLDWEHHRTASMTAELFGTLCQQAGLQCLTQELINWRGRRLIDCFSHFVQGEAGNHPPPQIIRNPDFMREVARIRRSTLSAKR